jgi:hypothetical protein
MTLIGITEAAERLGVSTRQVQHLVARGELTRLARGVVDETSLDRLIAVRGGRHTRAWSPATAWAAVSLLSGSNAEWMGESQRSRLRSRLRAVSSEELVERARDRAEVTRYRAHSSAKQHLAGVVVSAVAAAGRLGLADVDIIDGYLPAEAVQEVVNEKGLIRDDEGRVVLRATGMNPDVIRQLVERSPVLTALDLAESLDVRERRAGLDGLARALDAFRA